MAIFDFIHFLCYYYIVSFFIATYTTNQGFCLKQPSKLSITLFRHGQSTYVQGNVPCDVSAANDLCAKSLRDDEVMCDRIERAVEEVRASAKRLATSLDPAEPVTIISSPVGRTLHTARIVSEVLTQHGFTVKPIQTDAGLTEVANFSWDLFEPLINGGDVEYEGEKFTIDKAHTNPHDLAYPQYFMDDNAHHIQTAAKEAWPEAYSHRISSFERFGAVTDRFLNKMSELANNDGGSFILVSHDCAAMYLANHYTKGRQKGLVPGTYISIERRDDGRLVVTRVGDITDGDCETDFFAKRREYNLLCQYEAEHA
jgi:broad specificity phosphatase PhoE